jgi:hypothetical protein
MMLKISLLEIEMIPARDIGVTLTLKRSSATNFLGDQKLQISRLKRESSIL